MNRKKELEAKRDNCPHEDRGTVRGLQSEAKAYLSSYVEIKDSCFDDVIKHTGSVSEDS